MLVLFNILIIFFLIAKFLTSKLIEYDNQVIPLVMRLMDNQLSDYIGKFRFLNSSHSVINTMASTLSTAS